MLVNQQRLFRNIITLKFSSHERDTSYSDNVIFFPKISHIFKNVTIYNTVTILRTIGLYLNCMGRDALVFDFLSFQARFMTGAINIYKHGFAFYAIDENENDKVKFDIFIEQGLPIVHIFLNSHITSWSI